MSKHVEDIMDEVDALVDAQVGTPSISPSILPPRGGPLEATLRTPNGGSLRIDVEDQSLALTLTIDADGKRASVVLPEKSAATFKNLLIAVLGAAEAARGM